MSKHAVIDDLIPGKVIWNQVYARHQNTIYRPKTHAAAINKQSKAAKHKKDKEKAIGGIKMMTANIWLELKTTKRQNDNKPSDQQTKNKVKFLNSQRKTLNKYY